MRKSPEKIVQEPEFLWRQILEMPYFRGLLRAVEARFYQDITLPGPILDLGCGDGHFASAAFTQPVDVGIDPWTGPVKLASKQGSYKFVINGNGDQLPFPDGYFGSVISNSVLEHIEDLDSVLKEISRVTKPNATFVFCVPNHRFLSNLSVSNAFDTVGLKFLGDYYRNFFNRISRHHHCDNYDTWHERLKKIGFTIDKWWDYFSPQATHALEWGHYLGVPSLLFHFVFKRWIIVP
ncbi:MAG TPA: class I SAM-dependent methyltransferase, partial [Anaerolineaceae bacterium]|nr:class I SAM-dependent methyltransferase [Anaerolineaceae bacterium]